MILRIFPEGPNHHQARAELAGKTYPCAIGKAGVLPAPEKREGDRTTPAGLFPFRSVFYRQDKLKAPATGLSTTAIRTEDAWCDDPENPNYNQLVELPFPASAEALWREDDIYDLVVTIGHNDRPVRPHYGSAVFLHLARPDYSPTRGCVAFCRSDFLEILSLLTPQCLVRIHSK